MRNQYTGDFGDYVKYALLRQLTVDRKLGIAWYLNPDNPTTTHGSGVEYVYDPGTWRLFDPTLFDELSRIVRNSPRAIAQIENSPLFQGIQFANEPLPVDVPYPSPRPDCRQAWFESTIAKLADQNVVYVDPDIGLCEDDKFSYGALKTWEHVPAREVQRLACNAQGQKRPTIVYHTPGRTGDHEDQIQSWMLRLDCRHAFHAPTISIGGHNTGPRVFFVLNPDEQMDIDLVTFAQKWGAVGHLDERSP